MNQSPTSPMPAMVGAPFAPCRVCDGGGVVTLNASAHQREFRCGACEGRGCGQIVPESFVCQYCLGAGQNAYGRRCRRCKGLGHKRSMGFVDEVFYLFVAVSGFGLSVSFALEGYDPWAIAAPVAPALAGTYAAWRSRRRKQQVETNRLAWKNASVGALRAPELEPELNPQQKP